MRNLYSHDILKQIWISMSLEARMKQQKNNQKVPSRQAAIIISKTINIILFFNVVNVFFFTFCRI